MTIDTLAYAMALEEAGVERRVAEAHAEHHALEKRISVENNVNEHPRRRKSPAITPYKPIPRETGVPGGMERVWG
jgi:hypothetical protein